MQNVLFLVLEWLLFLNAVGVLFCWIKVKGTYRNVVEEKIYCVRGPVIWKMTDEEDWDADGVAR